MSETNFGFFEKYCLECHDSLTEKSGVNLEDLSFTLETIESAERWKKVLNSLNSGEMPPEDKPQPEPSEKEVFLSELSEAMALARRQLSDSGGKTVLRRLNRREYQNTIQDLLGIEVDVSGLPADVNSRGFDTDGASLFLSSDQIEQYLATAKKALGDVLLYEPPAEPTTIKVEPEILMNEWVTMQLRNATKNYKIFRKWKAAKGKLTAEDLGIADEQQIQFFENVWNRNVPSYADYLSRPQIKTQVLLTSFMPSHAAWLSIPDDAPPGRYTLRFNAGVLDRDQDERRYLEYGMIGERFESAMQLGGAVKVDPPGRSHGQIFNLEIDVPPVKYDDEGKVVERPVRAFMPTQRMIGIRERQSNSRSDVLIANANRIRTTGFTVEPALFVDWIEISGPKPDKDRLAGATRTLLHQPDEKIDDDAPRILRHFAMRAHRGKIPDNATIEKLVERYRAERKEGKSSRESLIDPMAILLAMPSFLYLKEIEAGTEDPNLTARELAVRLAYMLWASPPDDVLLRAARDGKLDTKEGLATEMERLLRDPKSTRFVEGFAHQWLHMERLDFFQFSYRLYPEFVDSTKEAARHEVYETFRHQLLENLPITDLLHSEYVVVNDMLADYYGLEDVSGPEFRAVTLPAESPRGGLLGMAAIHAMGSDGERSSLVERGAWVLRKLLHNPPPPAPPNVPQLSRHADKFLSARDLMAAHMEEAQCAQCHKKIDPIGYGLENFDAAGIWRDVEAVQEVKNHVVFKEETFPIEVEGTLPGGETFTSYFEMREAIAENYQRDFVTGFLEHLIAYSLGRSFSFSDEAWLEDILEQTEADGWRLQDLIRATVTSERFREG